MGSAEENFLDVDQFGHCRVYVLGLLHVGRYHSLFFDFALAGFEAARNGGWMMLRYHGGGRI